MQMEQLLQFCNLKHTMNDAQVVFTVDLMLEEYPRYRLEDFAFFFKEAAKARFGKIYDRIDGNMLLQWLKEYDIRRCEEIEMMRVRENSQYKKNQPSVLNVIPDLKDLQKTIGKKPVKKQWTREIVQEHQDEAIRQRDLSTKQYMAEFETMWEEQRDEINKIMGGNSPIKLIRYKEVVYDTTQYIAKRFEEEAEGLS